MCHTELLHIYGYISQQQPYFLNGFFSFFMFVVIFCASFDQQQRECYFFAHIAKTDSCVASACTRASKEIDFSVWLLLYTRKCVSLISAVLLLLHH